MSARAYYNEIDPFAAQWLRNLIAAGHIPDGDVDERSIVDVRADDIVGYRQAHFFAGIGGWPYALHLARWPDDRPAWSGSCPCQPLSSAGKHRGHLDERHLWPAFQHLIAECRPPVVFGEQVASKDGREWFAAVRADLEDMGYAAGAGDICAAGVGAPHIRQRIFWVADDVEGRRSWPGNRESSSNQERDLAPYRKVRETVSSPDRAGLQPSWPPGPSCIGQIPSMDDGVPPSMGGRDALGNAIVPQVAAQFIASYMDCAPWSPSPSPVGE